MNTSLRIVLPLVAVWLLIGQVSDGNAVRADGLVTASVSHRANDPETPIALVSASAVQGDDLWESLFDEPAPTGRPPNTELIEMPSGRPEDNPSGQDSSPGKSTGEAESESLGDKLRARSLEAMRSSEPDSNSSDSNSSESGDEEGSDEDDKDFDANDEELERRSRRSKLDHLQRLRKPVSRIRIGLSSDGARTPENLSMLDRGDEETILVAGLGISVSANDRYSVGFCHRPLYFEQPNLERCGQAFGYCQNLISGIQFVANAWTLPYHMSQQRPDCPVGVGGDCRTCQTYPVDFNPFPLDRGAFLSEMAAIGGFAFLLL